MAARSVTDSAGRTWTCTSSIDNPAQGEDVLVGCATPAVAGDVNITVGWQWETMSSAGLARLISTKSPAPKR